MKSAKLILLEKVFETTEVNSISVIDHILETGGEVNRKFFLQIGKLRYDMRNPSDYPIKVEITEEEYHTLFEALINNPNFYKKKGK